MAQNIYENIDIRDHDHCLHCIFPQKCKNKLPEHRDGCLVIQCPHNCNAIFHACKAEEHFLLCSQMKVPCINRGYGCPLWMKRFEISNHLQICPASVVHCSCERNRKTLGKLGRSLLKKNINDSQSKKEPENKDPDIEIALSDQRKIQEVYKLDRQTRNKTTNFFNHYHPQIPLLKKYPTKIPGRDEGVGELEDSSDEDEAKEKRKWEKSLSPVMRECPLCKLDPGSQHLHVLGSGMSTSTEETEEQSETSSSKDYNQKNIGTMLFPKIYTKNNLFLDLSTDFLPHTVRKQRYLYTIVCGQNFRRDQFSAHYKNVHADIMCSIDGWNLFRCPFMEYGCEKIFQRMFNKETPSILRFDSELDTFRYLSHIENSYDNPSTNTNLLDLSHDLLFRVLSFLDGCSLLSVSLVCTKLRELSCSQLGNKGIVTQSWISTLKNGNNPDEDPTVSWIQGPMLWTFSKSWKEMGRNVINNNAEYLNHLNVCPFKLKVTEKKYRQTRIPVIFIEPKKEMLQFIEHIDYTKL